MIPDLSKGSQTIINTLIINPAMNIGMQSLIDYGLKGIAQGKQLVKNLKGAAEMYVQLKSLSSPAKKHEQKQRTFSI